MRQGQFVKLITVTFKSALKSLQYCDQCLFSVIHISLWIYIYIEYCLCFAVLFHTVVNIVCVSQCCFTLLWILSVFRSAVSHCCEYCLCFAVLFHTVVNIVCVSQCCFTLLWILSVFRSVVSHCCEYCLCFAVLFHTVVNKNQCALIDG